MHYTLQTLQGFGPNRPYRVSELDVEKINRLCNAIAAMRSGDPVPTDGDRIICMTSTQGQVSDHGYLERRKDLLMICSKPSGIHLDEHQDSQIYTSASGGPWTGYMSEAQFLEQADAIGKTMMTFWTWRSRGNGDLSFEAEVFLWRFTSMKGF